MHSTGVRGRFSPSARGLTMEFRGFAAVKDVDLDVARRDPRADRSERRRQDHGLQPAHQVPTADAGRIEFLRTATSPPCSPAEVARLGLVRSFQISAVFPHLTVLDNIRVALQRPHGLTAVLALAPALDALDAAR